MMIADDFLDELNKWNDELPNISNESAYELSEFLHMLMQWVDVRYHTQISEHFDDNIPKISNEAAYTLFEFAYALFLWVDTRYYTQISAHDKEIMKNRYNPDAPWETVDKAIDDPSSND
jgi:hypothetical protein